MNAIATGAGRSHADIAATTLRQALAASHAQLRDAVTTYRAAAAALTPDADLLDVLRATGGIVLAAAAITAASKQRQPLALRWPAAWPRQAAPPSRSPRTRCTSARSPRASTSRTKA
jgi:hypothetical protein